MSVKILLVSRTLPQPPTTGGEQRVNLIHRALSEVGDVELLAVREETSVAPETRRLLADSGVSVTWAGPLGRGDYWPWKVFRRLNPRLIDRLAHNLGRRLIDYRPDPNVKKTFDDLCERHGFDLIVGRPVHHTALSGALDSGIPVIIDVDDFDPQVYRSWLETPGIPLWKRVIISHHLWQLERIVPKVIEPAAHLWIATKADRPLILHPRVSLLRNIPFEHVKVDERDIDAEENVQEESVLFIGAMNYRVNRDGVDHFARQVWPIVLKRRPNAVLRICGSAFTEALMARWESLPGVRPEGFVEDLGAAYRQSRISVVPLFEGGGTKIKVLESLMYGRTAVVSAHAQRGYEKDLRHGESLLVGKNDAELAEHCVQLLTNTSLRKQLAHHGLRQVRELYSYRCFRNTVENTVKRYCGSALK